MEGTAPAVAVKEKKERRERGTGRIWKRGETYWIQFYDQHGRQIRESTGSSVLQVAERKLRRRLGEAEAGLLPDLKATRVTVADLAESFLQDFRVNGKNIRWAEKCWNHLKPTFGEMRASYVTTDEINGFIEKRKAKGASNATVNRDLACLHRMFTLGMRCTPPKVQRVPIFPPRLKESAPRSGFIEDAQYEKLCENYREPWLRAFLAVAYTFGFRKAELLGLRVRQVDLLERTIRLNPGETKSDEGRVVKMTDEVHLHLTWCVRGKRPDDYVFTWKDGSPVKDFRGSWSSLTKTAGLPGLKVHDFRRSAVRVMIRRGIPEVVAMRISGHKTRSVFDRYNIVSEADLADAAKRIENGRKENGANSGTIRVQQTTQAN